MKCADYSLNRGFRNTLQFMKQLAHIWHSTCCQCVQNCSHVSSIQNNFMYGVLGLFLTIRLWFSMLCRYKGYKIAASLWLTPVSKHDFENFNWRLKIIMSNRVTSCRRAFKVSQTAQTTVRNMWEKMKGGLIIYHRSSLINVLDIFTAYFGNKYIGV